MLPNFGLKILFFLPERETSVMKSVAHIKANRSFKTVLVFGLVPFWQQGFLDFEGRQGGVPE